MSLTLTEEQEALIKKQEEDLRNKTATERIADAVERIAEEFKKLGIFQEELKRSGILRRQKNS